MAALSASGARAVDLGPDLAAVEHLAHASVPHGDVAIMIGRRTARVVDADPARLDAVDHCDELIVEAPPGRTGDLASALEARGFRPVATVPAGDGARVVHAVGARAADRASPEDPLRVPLARLDVADREVDPDVR